jgi:DNA-binding response OmpR family regulator
VSGVRLLRWREADVWKAKAVTEHKRAPYQFLLAEDNSADVLLVRRALKNHSVDCQLHVMLDGAEAIQWLTRADETQIVRSLDLMLLDMHLPKHDGEDILKALRSTRSYGQTPVIVMTSQDSRSLQGAASKNAALYYFKKPSSLKEFMELGSIVKSVLASSAKSLDGAKKETGCEP